MPRLPKQKEKTWIVKRKRIHKGSRKYLDQKDGVDIYQTKQWKATRRHHIQKNPICKSCFEKEKRVIPGDVVDHIVPIRQGGQPFDFDNLQTLCHPCHNIKSRKEKDTITYTKASMYR